ncbi:hypothetical protein O181_064923 [Austropuccinia psidii MF-1]|uniref:Transposase Tc1-like domain-containing protein n=1 Tax=Austropuccinia psidii MF-1 TaxID=1389203 RepID=A0A9Q3EUG1_9BASI|nr:hypothetical protein [Austropuccinia psidii MF-1]
MTQRKSGRPTKLTERDRRQLSLIITRCRRLTVAQVTSLMTSHHSMHWTINEWAKVIWTEKSAFELGKWSDEFPRDGTTGLPPSPSPLCQANGASTLDQRTTSTSPNGRQCTNSYGSFQQSVARAKRHSKYGVASTFTRPQPNRKYLEVDEKLNSEALPTSKFRRTQACYSVLLERHSPWHPQ